MADLDKTVAALNERVNKLSSEVSSLRIALSNNINVLNGRINETVNQLQAVLKKLNEKGK